MYFLIILLNVLLLNFSISSMGQDGKDAAQSNEEIQKRRLEAKQRLEKSIDDLKKLERGRKQSEQAKIEDLSLDLTNISSSNDKSKIDRNYINYILKNFSKGQIEFIRLKLLNDFEKEYLAIFSKSIINCDEKNFVEKKILRNREAIFSPDGKYIIGSETERNREISLGFIKVEDVINNNIRFFKFNDQPKNRSNQINSLTYSSYRQKIFIVFENGEVGFYDLKSDLIENSKYHELFDTKFVNFERICNRNDVSIKFTPDEKYIIAPAHIIDEYNEISEYPQKIIVYDLQYIANINQIKEFSKQLVFDKRVVHCLIDPIFKNILIVLFSPGRTNLKIYDVDNLKLIDVINNDRRPDILPNHFRYTILVNDDNYILSDGEIFSNQKNRFDFGLNENPLRKIQLSGRMSSNEKYVLLPKWRGEISLIDLTDSWLVKNFNLAQLFLLLKIKNSKNINCFELINNSDYKDIFDSFTPIEKDQIKNYIAKNIISNYLQRDVNNTQEADNISRLIWSY